MTQRRPGPPPRLPDLSDHLANAGSLRVAGLETRPRDHLRSHTPSGETPAVAVRPEDGTLLDAIPLPDTGKLVLIVAHVVPDPTASADVSGAATRQTTPGETGPTWAAAREAFLTELGHLTTKTAASERTGRNADPATHASGTGTAKAASWTSPTPTPTPTPAVAD